MSNFIVETTKVRMFDLCITLNFKQFYTEAHIKAILVAYTVRRYFKKQEIQPQKMPAGGAWKVRKEL